MKAIFLCGGTGKRMFPLTEDKFLLHFLGKPLLQHQIETAQEAGLRHFVFIANPGNIERLREITEKLSGAQVELVLQEEPLGIADALKSATHLLQGQAMVINPNDVFLGSAYSKIISASHQLPTAISYMLAYQVSQYFPGGYLELDSQGNLKRIVEKPAPGEEPSDLVNILVHLHNEPQKLLEYIKLVQSTRDDVYECALDNMVRAGHKIRVIPYTDFWSPIKYPWHIFKVMEYFLDRAKPDISPTARISPKATIEGKAILGENVKVLENAVIRGPVYIGPNSVIGNNALVRDHSHIGSNCVVGYCTEVKHSYIGDNCWFHSNYIGDSIIDDNCSFGAGTVLANFRLDEGNVQVKIGGSKVDTGYDKLGAMTGQGCRIGVNASLMPGVKVGPGSFVGPQVCLAKDLDTNKLALSMNQYQVWDNNSKSSQDKRKELLRRLEREP